MADTLEDIRYRFTGDIGDLRDATQKAMSLLDSYAQKFKKTDKDSTMKKSKKSFQEVRESLSNLGKEFKSSTKQAKAFTSSMKQMSSVSSIAKKALAGLTGLKLGDMLADATKESIKYVENLNLFKVAMGESVEEGLKFVDAMSEIYGMDPSNLYRYAGYFYQLTDAIGMADEASATMSLSMTKAANDIASLFNVEIEQVVNNLASGMQGMTRAVRKYGMDIRTTTLQQTALSYGLTEQVENMSEANRMALRYLTMMQQVKNATSQVVDETVSASGVMGDFARNIETPANQLRIFKEQVTQLGRAIGNFLIPIISKLLPVINGVIMALRTVLQFLASITGISLDFGGVTSGAADTAEAVSNIGEAADEASDKAKKLRNTLAPFDELNLLQAPPEDTAAASSDAGSVDNGLLDPALLDAIKNMSLGLDDIQMKATKIRDKILDFLGFKWVDVFNPDTGEWEKKLQWFAEAFEKNLIDKFPQWEKTIKALFDNWGDIMAGFKSVFEAIGRVIDTIKEKVKNFIASLKLDERFAAAIEALPQKLNALATWIDEHNDQIANFILTLGALFAAFKAFMVVETFLMPIITLGTRLAPVIASLSTYIVVIGAIIGTFALLYQNSELFAQSFTNLFSVFVSSFTTIAEAVELLVARIWESIQVLWVENIQPMIESFGDALAPIMDTLAVLWETLVTLFEGIMDMLGNLWEGTVQPIIASVANVITNLMRIIQSLWTDVIGPVIENVLQSLPSMWSSAVQPIIENVIGIIGNLIEIVLSLWNNFLAPLILWVSHTFGPTFASVFNGIWSVVSRVITAIGSMIADLLYALRGVTEFLVGVFTNDWDRAWNGIKMIFTGIVNAIIGNFEFGMNALIDLTNGLIQFIFEGVKKFINKLLKLINKVGSVIGQNWELSWESPPPEIGHISVPRVAMAEGGVVTGPTQALIGEGRYDEAVIPLGNSPQMTQMLDAFSSRSGSDEQIRLLREQNTLLRQILDKTGVSIDGRSLSDAVGKYQGQKLMATGGYV